MMTSSNKARLIVISGPSGAGKSTVVRRLIELCELPLELSVSATTRKPRTGEVHGREYFFLSPDEFETQRTSGKFLECKEVYGRGIWYGTLKEVVDRGLAAGKWVILEIDVQGALTVFQNRNDLISIFVHPGSMAELERRLRARGTESENQIARRLEVASEEMALRHLYQHEVINNQVDSTVNELCNLLKQFQGDSQACSKS
jgi:guanylate kinase